MMLGLRLGKTAEAVNEGRQVRARFPVQPNHLCRLYRESEQVVLETARVEQADRILGVFLPAGTRRQVEYWKGYVLPVLDDALNEVCWVQIYRVSHCETAGAIDDEDAWCEGFDNASEVRRDYALRYGPEALSRPAWVVDFGIFLGSHPLIPADFPSFRCWVPGPVEARMYSSDTLSACEAMPFTGIRRFWQKVASHPEAAQFVMRGTNLRDRNGREIFEGDLVRIPHALGEFTGLIRWESVRFTVHAPWAADRCAGSMANVENRPADCEIIGNMFEQPDLMPALFVP